MFYFARCMNIIFNQLPAQLVKYDVHTTSKIKFMLAIFITYYYFTVLISSSIWDNNSCLGLQLLDR